jgi:hypothetical protein
LQCIQSPVPPKEVTMHRAVRVMAIEEIDKKVRQALLIHSTDPVNFKIDGVTYEKNKVVPILARFTTLLQEAETYARKKDSLYLDQQTYESRLEQEKAILADLKKAMPSLLAQIEKTEPALFARIQ